MDIKADKLGAVAELSYMDGDFDVVRPGTHVMCAVTGQPIPLEMLRYWSVALQEAYIDADASLQAYRNAQADPRPDDAEG
ncbi:MAG: DUF2093 domain-containing protein [Parvibaculales bacterium]